MFTTYSFMLNYILLFRTLPVVVFYKLLISCTFYFESGTISLSKIFLTKKGVFYKRLQNFIRNKLI